MVGLAALKKRARACLGKLHKAPPPPPPPGARSPLTTFLCNVCGTPNCLPRAQLVGDGGHCMFCGCSGRQRSIAYAVAARFSTDDVILTRMAPRKDLRGLGCSDWGYADALTEKFEYVDSFFDREPQLDLLDVDWSRWTPESFDFITCASVPEYVRPTIDEMFKNVYRLLRPGGAAVIAAPPVLGPKTGELTCKLHHREITAETARQAAVDRRTGGATERIDDVNICGAVETTRPIRSISRQALIDGAERAGLRAAEIYERPIGAYALPLGVDDFVLTAEKPGGDGSSRNAPCFDPYRLLGDCQQEIADRRAASGPDEFDYAAKYGREELGYWLHVPGWIYQDFGRRAARGERLTCLDVGCAYGTLLLYATKLLDCEPYAIDFVDYLERSLIADYGFHYQLNNIEREAFPWRLRFDVILFTEVLEHLNFNALPTLRKLAGRLLPGGRLYLTTPDAAQWGRQTKYYQAYSDLPQPSEAARFSVIDDHVWQFHEEELDRLLDAAGFRVVRRAQTPGSGRRHFNMTLAAI